MEVEREETGRHPTRENSGFDKSNPYTNPQVKSFDRLPSGLSLRVEDRIVSEVELLKSPGS